MRKADHTFNAKMKIICGSQDTGHVMIFFFIELNQTMKETDNEQLNIFLVVIIKKK